MSKAEEIFAKVQRTLSETDRDIWADMELPQYHVVMTRPVKIVRTEDGSPKMLKFDWDTGGYVDGDNLWADVFLSHGGDVEQVTEDEFIQYVEELRARRIKGEGTVFTLYEITNAVIDKAREEGRRLLTKQERDLVTSLRKKTFVLFEKMLADKKVQESVSPGEDKSEPPVD